MAMEARNRPLPEWFSRIESGQIRLPRFQRFQAWSHSEIGDLLETVLRQLPSGATLILEIGDKEPFVSRPLEGAPDPSERVTEHLLDGQQRLTALWRSLHDNYPDRTYFFWIEPNDGLGGEQIVRIHGQARWQRNGQRYPLWADDPAESFGRDLIPIRLLRPGDIRSETREWCDAATGGDLEKSRDLEAQIQDLRQVVATYNIPFLSLPPKTPRDVALDVFIKMNTSSVRLTPFDIIVAEVEEETGQSLHDLVTNLKVRLPAINHYAEASNLVLNVGALRADRAPTQGSYQRLDLVRLVNEWDQVIDGVAWTIEVLEEENIYDGQRLPTVAVLPVVAALHSWIPGALDGLGNAKSLIRKYLWRAFLTSRYENQAATRALQDFRALRSVLRDGSSDDDVPVFNEELFPLPSRDELVRAGWPRTRETLARGILAVTLKGGARDIADGTPATRNSLSRREYHHLFPDSLLVNMGQLSKQESFRALNCALLTWNTNRSISAKTPLQYLIDRTERSALGEAEIRSRLASQLIPFDSLAVGGYDDLDEGERAAQLSRDYEKFLEVRASILETPIRLLCAGKIWPTAQYAQSIVHK